MTRFPLSPQAKFFRRSRSPCFFVPLFVKALELESTSPFRSSSVGPVLFFPSFSGVFIRLDLTVFWYVRSCPSALRSSSHLGLCCCCLRFDTLWSVPLEERFFNGPLRSVDTQHYWVIPPSPSRPSFSPLCVQPPLLFLTLLDFCLLIVLGKAMNEAPLDPFPLPICSLLFFLDIMSILFSGWILATD